MGRPSFIMAEKARGVHRGVSLILEICTSITLAGSWRIPPSQRRNPNRSSLGLISTFSVTSWVRPLANLPPSDRRDLRWITWRNGLISARTSSVLNALRKRSSPVIWSAGTLLTRLTTR